jgi:excinuclease UvrABC nuclease subunit
MLKDSPIWDFLEGWKTPDCYSNAYAPLPHTSGVYLLVLATMKDGLLDHEIVYIGQSRNIAKRLTGHNIKKLCQEYYGPKAFIKVYFKHYANGLLRRRERRLIQRFNPPFNLQHRTRGI